jgi:glycosyltransferase involved in cell wall biosynthesis
VNLKEKFINNMTGSREVRILFMGQLPPPVHGVTMMNNNLVNSKILQANFHFDIVNLHFITSIDEISKYSIRKVVKAIGYGYEVTKKLLRNKPDLVYFTISPKGYAFFRDSLYVFILKTFRKKIVFHLHGKGIRESSRSNLIIKALSTWILRNSYVICLSERLVPDIEGVYRSTPFVVQNGIKVQSDSQERKSHVKGSVPNILYLSNYARDKGILILIDALKILQDKGVPFRARLVGASANLTVEFLMEVIRKQHLEEFVEITGPRYDEAKRAEFREADLFVFPSLNDAFPLVILEAMQYSLPVVASFEGGIPDMVVDKETGFLIADIDANKLSDKLSVLLKNEDLRHEMGRNGHIRFMNNFTIDHFEKNMLTTFQNILSQA